MIAKLKNVTRNKKKLSAIIVCTAIACVILGGAVVLSVRGGTVLTSPIVASVVLNGETYTSTNKYQILEIVPQAGQAEIGYMVGGSRSKPSETSMPIPDADIVTLKNAGATDSEVAAIRALIKQATQFAISDTGSDCSKYPDDCLEIPGYGDRNVFAYSILKNSNMTDKVKVTTKSAPLVTKADIDAADFVYVNPGTHSSIYAQAWNQMSSIVTKYKSKLSSTITDKYVSVSSGTTGSTQTFNKSDNRYNFTADVALQIYQRAVVGGMPLVFDNSQVYWNSPNNAIDYYKDDAYSALGIMLLGIEQNTFIKEYADTKGTGTYDNYSGTEGSVSVYSTSGSTTNPKLSIKVKEGTATLAWDAYMFVTANGNTVGYPYFNAGTRNSLYLSGNILSFSGYNLMDMIFSTGGDARGDFDSQGNYLGTDFELAKAIYGVDKDGKLIYSNMVGYIMGVQGVGTYAPINVLEIEPSGAYEYNGYDGAVKILKYFGYNTASIDNNPQSNAYYKKFVNVKSVASNGFNGMNEDLSEVYDLIIVGANNPSTYLKTSTIYTKKAETAKINNTTQSTKFSGNDLTLKSVNKLLEYAKKRKPLVLAEALFDGNTSLIDSTSNISGMSLDKIIDDGIPASNIISRPSGEPTRKLYRLNKPVINVSAGLDMTYSGDLAVATVNTSQLSTLPFSGTIGTDQRAYRLVIYIDKDGNGLFAPESTDDTNEVFYNGVITTKTGGSFEVILDIPEASRGYMAWKVIATDIATGLSSEDTGGFVITVNASDIKTVKVLQILPGKSGQITLNLGTSARFKSLFAATEAVSGLKLEITVMTTREYESLFLYGKTYYKGNYVDNNMLKKYSMVILGFSDAYLYDDISNAHGALDNLYDYIEKGNSVLFAHDTTSFGTYSDGTGNYDYAGIITNNNAYRGWCYNMTSTFRHVIGMDRYDASINPRTNPESYIQGYSNEFLFRFGKVNGATYSIYNGYPATNSNIMTTKVNKLNQGQVTEFPYKTGSNLTVASTHAQYFQLDLEGHTNVADDVVVWYTLGSEGGNSLSRYYDFTGQDALNSFYIYSKGNITYSGAGHDPVSGDPELKLFVNTVIRAIMSGNSVPEVEVNNAAIVSSGRYELYSREENDLPVIEFVATDKDLSKYTGQFKSGLVYLDVDRDGTYNDGDLRLDLKFYCDKAPTGSYTLYNARTTTINLEELKNLTSQTIYNQVKAAYDNKTLRIGIQATDGRDAIGEATIAIAYRHLFNLK